jgi:catechol 2,3-dioxygenase-like lactoylglutathione lyase family enzyme
MTDKQSRWGGVTVDCRDPERLAAFWAAMLDTSVRGRWQQYVNLHTAPGAPGLAFQRVDDKTPGKNALHLDVHVTQDIEVEPTVQRALALGARVHSRVQQDDTAWVVLLDPEGNQFCVVATGAQYG